MADETKRKAFLSGLARTLDSVNGVVSQCGPRIDPAKLDEDYTISEATGYWENPNAVVAKPPRWLIQLFLHNGHLQARLPADDRSLRIAFYNATPMPGKKILGLTVRVLTPIETQPNAYTINHNWEWILFFCLKAPLPRGHSAQPVDLVSIESGDLTFNDGPLPYVYAGLVAIESPQSQVEIPGVGGALPTVVTYGQATNVLRDFIKINPSR